jgi:hypothetical protein
MAYNRLNSRRLTRDGEGCGKGKQGLVKYNITRDVDTAYGTIETLISLVHRTIAQEYTLSRAQREFVIIIGPQIWLASATKSTKKPIIRLFMKESF